VEGCSSETRKCRGWSSGIYLSEAAMRKRVCINLKSRFESGRDINCISEWIQHSWQRLLGFRAKETILSSGGSNMRRLTAV
jgi:cysteine sulfinate desulfinase/cysteine desulfurase-like protein